MLKQCACDGVQALRLQYCDCGGKEENGDLDLHQLHGWDLADIVSSFSLLPLYVSSSDRITLLLSRHFVDFVRPHVSHITQILGISYCAARMNSVFCWAVKFQPCPAHKTGI